MPSKPQKYYRYQMGGEEGFLMTLDEIGERLGISKERVRQILQTAMRNFEAELNKRNIRLEDVFD